ncbi:Hypothetical predicted protein [Pelobates cultripes]|uniref:Uncharacterized protein n=1 Tax=Pelobates cultripes TaxID=61616 RepID=A0AAD1R0L5_PELCU|nr:Hypothetical predicted protein [Pelobates cultripes]
MVPGMPLTGLSSMGMPKIADAHSTHYNAPHGADTPTTGRAVCPILGQARKAGNKHAETNTRRHPEGGRSKKGGPTNGRGTYPTRYQNQVQPAWTRGLGGIYPVAILTQVENHPPQMAIKHQDPPPPTWQAGL